MRTHRFPGANDNRYLQGFRTRSGGPQYVKRLVHPKQFTVSWMSLSYFIQVLPSAIAADAFEGHTCDWNSEQIPLSSRHLKFWMASTFSINARSQATADKNSGHVVSAPRIEWCCLHIACCRMSPILRNSVAQELPYADISSETRLNCSSEPIEYRNR